MRLVDPARRPRPPAAGRAPHRARRRPRPPAGARGGPPHRGQVRGAPVLRAARDPLAGELASGSSCPTTSRTRCSSSRGGASARGTSTAQPTARSSTSTFAARPAESFVQQVCVGRGVLDRRLLRLRGPLPRRDPPDDDRVEGRRIDQGHVDQGRGTDRVRPAGLGDAADLGPGERPVLPGRRRTATRSPTSTRASAAASRCRSPPADATRSSRSRSRGASGRSRASATSARA